MGAPRRMVSVFDFCVCCICRSPPNIKGISRTALARLIGISPPPGSLRAAPIACDGFITLKLWLDRSIFNACISLGRFRGATPGIGHWFYRSAPSVLSFLPPISVGRRVAAHLPDGSAYRERIRDTDYSIVGEGIFMFLHNKRTVKRLFLRVSLYDIFQFLDRAVD